MKVYVDDMVVKRKKEGLPDLHPGIIWSTSEVQYEVKPEKMQFWSSLEQVHRIPGHQVQNRGPPKLDQDNKGDAVG